MQKWEYMLIRTIWDGSNCQLVIRINDEDIGKKEGPLSSKKYPRFLDVLNEYGEEGWELVLDAGGSYTFKRPK
jgi:hypothetical protein